MSRKDKTPIQNDTCTPMFIAALCINTVAIHGNNPSVHQVMTDLRACGICTCVVCVYVCVCVCVCMHIGLPWWFSGKESTCKCRRCGFNPWVGKISWRKKWQPTPIFLLGKSHGQRSLACYTPWGHKRIVLSHKTEWNIGMCSHTDEPREYYI